MIGLDTNVLVRYLTQDDAEQSARANRLIEASCSRKSPDRVALVVLCELVWVLRGAYRYDKALIVNVLGQILATAELEVEADDVVARALRAYEVGAADFTDYVIVFGNATAGCGETYTFDRKLLGQAGVREP